MRTVCGELFFFVLEVYLFFVISVTLFNENEYSALYFLKKNINILKYIYKKTSLKSNQCSSVAGLSLAHLTEHEVTVGHLLSHDLELLSPLVSKVRL